MSWLDKEEVDNLREVYNKEHKNEPPIPKGSTEEQWSQLQARLHEKCSTGTSECIISSLLRRPRAPKQWVVNRYEWLSSDDIAAVEKNYEDIFADYCFLGCVPIDFDLKSETQACVVSTLCSIKISELYKKGHHRLGIVFNTDPHDGPGEHWVALFCDVRPELEFPRITYFDSYAHTPEKEIQTLMKRWKEQWDQTKIHSSPMKMTYNATRHQFKDSECGMYCLYFHYACLMGIPMETQVPDDIVNGFRNLLFTMPKE
jgi:hypothetical protein